MRRWVFVMAIVVIGSVVAAPALAQGKDPFLPPNSGTAPAPGSAEPGAPGSGAFEPPQDSGNGLARTGEDVGTQLAIAVALLSLGAGLRLTVRAMTSLRATPAAVRTTGT